VNALREYEEPEPVETALTNVFDDDRDTDWDFDGLVSIVVNIQLKGVFPERFRGKDATIILE